MTKNGLGEILGHFITNSSGHPAAKRILKDLKSASGKLSGKKNLWTEKLRSVSHKLTRVGSVTPGINPKSVCYNDSAVKKLQREE
jgi:hypothetical protein